MYVYKSSCHALSVRVHMLVPILIHAYFNSIITIPNISHTINYLVSKQAIYFILLKIY